MVRGVLGHLQESAQKGARAHLGVGAQQRAEAEEGVLLSRVFTRVYKGGTRAHLGVGAQQRAEAEEGVLLLDVVADGAQRAAPGAAEDGQVRRELRGAHPGHAAERDRAAGGQTGLERRGFPADSGSASQGG